jgi:hypothetical protein
MGSTSTASRSFLSRRLAWALTGWALGGFALGLLVYAVARDATRLVPPGLALSAGRAGWSVLLRDNLPSFAHTYTFVLLACAWFARSWRQALAISLVVWLLDVSLELLQQPQLHERLASPPWARALFASTFDTRDLLASTAGVLIAWCTLAAGRRTQRKSIA